MHTTKFGVNLQAKLDELQNRQSQPYQSQLENQDGFQRVFTSQVKAPDARVFLQQVSDHFGASSFTNRQVQDVIIRYSRGQLDILRLYVSIFLIFRDSDEPDWFCHFERFLPPSWQSSGLGWFKHAIIKLLTQAKTGDWTQVTIGQSPGHDALKVSALVAECRKILSAVEREPVLHVSSHHPRTTAVTTAVPAVPHVQAKPSSCHSRAVSVSSYSGAQSLARDALRVATQIDSAPRRDMALHAPSPHPLIPFTSNYTDTRQSTLNRPGSPTTLVSARASTPTFLPVKVPPIKRRADCPRLYPLPAIAPSNPYHTANAQFQQSQFVAFPQAQVPQHHISPIRMAEALNLLKPLEPVQRLDTVRSANHSSQNLMPGLNDTTSLPMAVVNPTPRRLRPRPRLQPLHNQLNPVQPAIATSGPPTKKPRGPAKTNNQRQPTGPAIPVPSLESDEARILGLGLRARK